jgi:hypothetical protein
VAVAAEPHRVPDAPRGARDLGHSVALFCTGNEGSPLCSVIERGLDFVAVRWRDMAVMAVHVSPNIEQAEYTSFLDGMVACVIRLHSRPPLILGDRVGFPKEGARGDGVGGQARPPTRKPGVVYYVCGVAGRGQRRPHLGETCCRWPCLGKCPGRKHYRTISTF